MKSNAIDRPIVIKPQVLSFPDQGRPWLDSDQPNAEWPTIGLVAVSAFLALMAWCPLGSPAWALLVVIPWSCCGSRCQLFCSALAYYLVSTWQLPIMATRFFELSVWLSASLGALAWIFWAAMQAAVPAATFMRSTAWRPAGILLGLVLTAVPPMGWFAVMSPLHSIGYWFPGTRWAGLALAAGAILALAGTRRLRWIWPLAAVSAICYAGIFTQDQFLRSTPPSHWTPVNTHFGGFPKSLTQELQRMEVINSVVLEARQVLPAGRPAEPPTGAAEGQDDDGDLDQVLVFPELAVPDWRPRSQYWLQPAINATRDGHLAFITGAMRRATVGSAEASETRMVNGLLVVQHGRVNWLDGRVSFPGAMWAPGQYMAPLSQAPVVELDDHVRAVFNICYEDLLPWTQLQAFAQRPDLLVGLASTWSVTGLDHGEQAAITAGWARLFGVPTLRAVNS